MTLLTIYVPATDDLHGILPGSAIVGSDGPDVEHIRVDYEGGKFGQSTFARFEERLIHAASRHIWNGGRGYPTIARSWLPPSELKAVGIYDSDTWSVVEITDQGALDAWNARYGEGKQA